MGNSISLIEKPCFKYGISESERVGDLVFREGTVMHVAASNGT